MNSLPLKLYIVHYTTKLHYETTVIKTNKEYLFKEEIGNITYKKEKEAVNRLKLGKRIDDQILPEIINWRKESGYIKSIIANYMQICIYKNTLNMKTIELYIYHQYALKSTQKYLKNKTKKVRGSKNTDQVEQ